MRRPPLSFAVRPVRAAFSAFLALLLLLSSAAGGSSVPRFASLGETLDYLAGCEEEQRTDIVFLLPTRALLQERPILEDVGEKGVFGQEDSLWNLIYALPSVFTLSYGASENGQDTCVRLGLAYRDGARLYRAWCLGRAEELTAPEKQALETALRFARQAAEEETPEARLLALCTLLCDHLTFQPPGGDENVKSCLTAFSRGRANCQGYSDAFFLAASLMGVRAGYQNGQVLATGEVHTFNTVETDGGIRYLDLTWMDRSDGMDLTQFCMEKETLCRTRTLYPPD